MIRQHLGGILTSKCIPLDMSCSVHVSGFVDMHLFSWHLLDKMLYPMQCISYTSGAGKVASAQTGWLFVSQYDCLWSVGMTQRHHVWQTHQNLDRAAGQLPREQHMSAPGLLKSSSLPKPQLTAEQTVSHQPLAMPKLHRGPGSSCHCSNTHLHHICSVSLQIVKQFCCSTVKSSS